MRELKFRAFNEAGMGLPFTLQEISTFDPTVDGKTSWPVSTIFMQYTGLRDKNGVEIYEGDLIKFFDKTVAFITWMDFGGWSFHWIDKTYIAIRQQNPEPIFRNIHFV